MSGDSAIIQDLLSSESHRAAQKVQPPRAQDQMARMGDAWEQGTQDTPSASTERLQAFALKVSE